MNLERFNDLDSIYICNPCSDEIKNLFKRDHLTEHKYLRWLHSQLQYLKEMKLESVRTKSNVFEKLDGTAVPIYSIRRNESTGNPRVLFFAIVEEENTQAIILLSAFKELNQGDYKRHLPTAIRRRSEILRLLDE